MTSMRAAFGFGAVFAVGGVEAVVGNAFSGKAARWGVGRLIVGAFQFLIWVVLGTSGPNEMGYRQSVTSDRRQGRMNATIRSLNWGMFTIGAPIGGLLAQHLGYRPALWIAIAGMAASAVIAALSPRRTARLSPQEEEKPTETQPAPQS
jgi:predicted MFS family arabinose efflux permease